MKITFTHTFGAEIEKPINEIKSNKPHITSQAFFERLQEDAVTRGTFDHFHSSDLKPDTVIGVISKDLGEQGLDNAWNLQETSLPYQKSLSELQKLMLLDLDTVQKALGQEGGSVINLSIHPLAKRVMTEYKTYVAPKGVYLYLWHRGWDHTAGIDARAQNSPTTAVTNEDVADAVSVVIGAGAAFIGLFANSPYEEGKKSLFKEARLTMWDRMIKNSRVAGDITTSRFPVERFRTMAQYFNWMFGGNTGIHFVIAENQGDHGNYKGTGDRILIVKEDPSVLDYLARPEWEAAYLKDLQNGSVPKPVMVKPHISHMETVQFAQFAGARVRYRLKDHDNFPVEEFVKVCKDQPQSRRVEEIFSRYAQYTYIEGRDPGANFPDQEIADAGRNIAESVVISPSAIQAGLIRNLKLAVRFIDGFSWKQLGELRTAAIKDGLQGEVHGKSVYEFAKRILEIAAGGLSNKEHSLLKYPEWVLKSKQNGADRAIQFVEQYNGSIQNAIGELVRRRSIVV